MSSSCGSASSARPMATRCFSPPESVAGPPLEQLSDAEQADDGVEARDALAPRREPAPEQQVLPHVQMRKEPAFLKDVTDPPLMPWARDPALRIDEDPPIDDDPAAARDDEPANRVDEVVLPDPDRPNSAVRRPSERNCASS